MKARREWSGRPCPIDPDNCWIDDKTGEHVNAKTGARKRESGLREINRAVLAKYDR